MGSILHKLREAIRPKLQWNKGRDGKGTHEKGSGGFGDIVQLGRTVLTWEEVKQAAIQDYWPRDTEQWPWPGYQDTESRWCHLSLAVQEDRAEMNTSR